MLEINCAQSRTLNPKLGLQELVKEKCFLIFFISIFLIHFLYIFRFTIHHGKYLKSLGQSLHSVASDNIYVPLWSFRNQGSGTPYLGRRMTWDLGGLSPRQTLVQLGAPAQVDEQEGGGREGVGGMRHRKLIPIWIFIDLDSSEPANVYVCYRGKQ